jgi:hypothetical protein
MFCDQRTFYPEGCGQEWIRTTEVERQRIYSPPHLAALEPARLYLRAEDGTRTRDLLITNQLLYQLSYSGKKKTFPFFGMAKVMESFVQQNFVSLFFHGIQTKSPDMKVGALN